MYAIECCVEDLIKSLEKCKHSNKKLLNVEIDQT